ncbi:ATP-binding protein (plasmid) [Streptomyces sp. NBC_00053]|uniref:ATP-binding protein n=1 Tax=unclassified Streptomyces TaxID=2593676 RepID=UPI00224E39B2|nr:MULTISPECIES: ATP-binding protein [unclassified Streptomyces]MCX4399937.1 ATP-binding protein [Streptomyces sp. NBC_01767]MCX5506059.1 ATP-binding protein [Streptomyces sp. NBC_00052]MCX5554286.1 ATP-binding protein [Streptomyces sp. NBC_00051]WSP52962.1 ATP-binding protein [Streptomyces sp. NBC_01243]
MRMPIRHVAGNVVWSVHGTVWALYRVQGVDQVHSSKSAKLRRLKALEALVKKLVGESMWLSLCPQVDPRAVVRAMTEDIDMAASTEYTQVAHRVLDTLEGLELTGRTDWLAVPLPAAGRRQRIADMAGAAKADIALHLGLLPAPISRKEERRRLAQAARMAATWPGTVAVRPASEAEILWIYGHSARRGVVEPLLPAPDTGRGIVNRGRTVAALGQAVLTEGAVDGMLADEEERRGAGVFRRRWVEVATEHGASYQAFLTLSEMPEAFRFPGSEYLAALDTFDFPVDWVVRLNVTPGAVAEARTRRKARDVAGQPDEWAHDPAGAPASVGRAADSLAENRERLTASKGEVDVRAMVAFCVWGASPQEAEQRAGVLTAAFGGDDYTLDRPLGDQERLFHGMLPGARTPQVMASYAQYLLARDFCMAGPWAATELGDERGPLYGWQLTGGGARPVLMDFTRGPKKRTSASAAYLGELGGGKSYAMKCAAYWTLAAGRKAGVTGSRGRAVIVDRTPKQEWLRFARACPGRTELITTDSSAAVSLDPLRVFTQQRGRVPVDLSEAQRRCESFLHMLLGIRPMDEVGGVLSEAVSHVLAGKAPSMRALMAHLTERGVREDDAACRSLARKLNMHARRDIARAVFDESLPVVDTDADSVVFSVAQLVLPKKWELEPGHFERLSPEKVFGRAALYLIAAICRHIAFDPRHEAEFCQVVWDECWWLTSSPEGLDLLLELVRDGRKHNAGVLVGSHDPDDIGPDTEAGRIVRGLFPRRYLFRQTNKELARRGLDFLGLDPNDPELLEMVTTRLSPLDESEAVQAQRAGECLVRDLFGRIGAMRVQMPLDASLADVIHSDPGQAAPGGAGRGSDEPVASGAGA